MKNLILQVKAAAICSIAYRCQLALIHLLVGHPCHDAVSASASMHTAPSSILSPRAMTDQLPHPNNNNNLLQ